MNKKLVASVLLASVVLTSCGKAPEVTETSETTTEQTTTTSAETTTDATTAASTTAATTADQSDIDEKFRGLVPGDTFTFGEYEGEEMSWIVLSTTGYVCYCIAEDNILVRNYDSSGRVDDRNDSDLFHWLNEDFYEGSFTDEEKVRIKYAVSESDISSDYKIYLLSRRDVMSYETILQAHPASDDWWLRSGSNSVPESVDICSCSGQVSYDGASCSDWNGVRPAMRLYIGVDEDRLDLANLTPTPTPAPSQSSSSEEEPAAAVVPSEMSYDASISEEANLEAYYNNNIAGLYGSAPTVPTSYGPVDTLADIPTWLDIPGALAHSIADFDGDGDLEMIAFVFVAELDDVEIENTEEIFYRMHLLLIDDVDGTIRMLQDLPVLVHYYDWNDEYCVSMDGMHTGIYNTAFYILNLRIYQINRDDKPYIMMTEELNANPIGDGFAEDAYIFEVSDNTILYSSTYSGGPGSDDTSAVEITYENGEPVSHATYYMYPDMHDAPGMDEGIDLYFDRQGLAHNDYDRNYGTVVTDPSAILIAEAGVRYVDEATGEYGYGPWTFNYEVQVGVG